MNYRFPLSGHRGVPAPLNRWGYPKGDVRYGERHGLEKAASGRARLRSWLHLGGCIGVGLRAHRSEGPLWHAADSNRLGAHVKGYCLPFYRTLRLGAWRALTGRRAEPRSWLDAEEQGGFA